MKKSQANRFLSYAVASIVLLIAASVSIAENQLGWTSIYPFFVFITLGYQYKVFRGFYLKEKPTLYVNTIQWLYLLILVYSLFLSFMVILDLIN